jgi:hypothetical protein
MEAQAGRGGATGVGHFLVSGIGGVCDIRAESVIRAERVAARANGNRFTAALGGGKGGEGASTLQRDDAKEGYTEKVSGWRRWSLGGGALRGGGSGRRMRLSSQHAQEVDVPSPLLDLHLTLVKSLCR